MGIYPLKLIIFLSKLSRGEGRGKPERGSG